MALTSQTEIERKYDADARTVVPELSGAPGIARTGEPTTVSMSAVYFDTADLSLAQNRIALRRRSGGGDAGWHLKLPATLGRTEVHAALTSDDRVPSELRAQVEVFLRGRPVTPLARVDTIRTAHELFDEDDRPVLELADDQVTGTDLRSGTVRVWHEWEAELVGREDSEPDVGLLDAVETILLDAGARRSTSSSKLAHALGADALGEGGPDEGGSLDRVPGRHAVAASTRGLEALDPRVRAGEPESVHDMRTTIRRLRSVLSAGGPAEPVAESVRDELGRLSSVLGEARDVEVRLGCADRLSEGTGTTADHTRRLARSLLEEELSVARTRILEYLNSTAYFQLLDALDERAARPGPTTAELATGVRAAARATSRRISAVLDQKDPRLAELHRLRKGARRLRYLAEALGASDDAAPRTTGAAAGTLGELTLAARQTQDLLGAHRDLILFADTARLAATQYDDADSAAWRRLWERASESADATLAGLPAVLADLERKIAGHLEAQC